MNRILKNPAFVTVMLAALAGLVVLLNSGPRFPPNEVVNFKLYEHTLSLERKYFNSAHDFPEGAEFMRIRAILPEMLAMTDQTPPLNWNAMSKDRVDMMVTRNVPGWGMLDPFKKASEHEHAATYDPSLDLYWAQTSLQPPGKIFFARSGAIITWAADCVWEGMPNPLCEARINSYRGITVTYTFGRSRLPHWRSDREQIQKFLDAHMK